MGEQFFDDLARGLDEGTISRRRALKLFGAAALGAVLIPEQAEALTRKARRICRRKGGIPLEKGNCHCAITCPFPGDQFSCHSNSRCICLQTVTGTGFCTDRGGVPSGCSSSDECPVNLNQVCVVNPGCDASGGSCTPATASTDCPANYGCVNGTCQVTACASPCPT